LLGLTVLTVAVLQWTGRWRSWASGRNAPGYALVNSLFGPSPLPPVILILNIPLMLAGFAISAGLRSDLGTYLTAAFALGTIGLATYIYVRQPIWSIPPWLRAARASPGRRESIGPNGVSVSDPLHARPP
jgi:hypothetical protein